MQPRPTTHRSKTGDLLLDPLQHIARLALQRLADAVKRGEAYGLGPPVLQHRDIRRRDADTFRQPPPTDILRLASITSRFTRIAMSDHHLQLVVLGDGGQHDERMTSISSTNAASSSRPTAPSRTTPGAPSATST